MLIFTTIVVLLALSDVSIARMGKLDTKCSKIEDWVAMDAAFIKAHSEADSVTEAYKMLVEREASGHMSRYRIESFMMACDAQLVLAHKSIAELYSLRPTNINCPSLILEAQKIINEMDANLHCLTSEALVFTDVHKDTIWTEEPESVASTKPVDPIKDAQQKANKQIECVQKYFKRTGYVQGEREARVHAAVDTEVCETSDYSCYTKANETLKKYVEELVALSQSTKKYRRDVCAEIEYDIATKAASIDSITLAAIGEYRLEFGRLESKFSTTIDKPTSYPYLSLAFFSDIKKLLHDAEGLLIAEIDRWTKLLDAYHKLVPANGGTSSEQKSKFKADCKQARSNAKILFVSKREKLISRYHAEMVFIPITVDLRSFDRTKWIAYRDEMVQNLQPQFEGLPSEYLNNPRKKAEREKFKNSLSAKEYVPLAYVPLPLWTPKPRVYEFLTEIADELNAFALKEFALARYHRDNHH